MTLLTIIFHIFNHKLDALAELKNFHQFWYNFLKIIKQFLLLNVDNDSIVTHCMEWLKNSILVVKTNKIMEKVSQTTGEDVWTKTWDILAEVSPSLQQQMDDSN
ncbi:hypothetical protein RFI_05379 [Reticulomyxa filosa]|uniref:Uncharacterized protein n=1 Tax=Reticulomyxa filosa TaxID=46433 RepID=X6P0I5_RETFI|nr:hypothetical protein RFI_05379 [Reticulomyxa filosa]|eukprot:ETO31741.1 hypothetical protein RFI_05379 [Reticulomyxa filosa]